ncbi:MAG TPA: urease accessory protein UreD [Gammaproteobacteria bacterium]
MHSEAQSIAAIGWRGELRLELARAGTSHEASGGARTVVAARRHRGPLNIQRAFYPEGELAHLYLLHPPGGVVGGDELHIDVDVQSGAQALITTPASGKLYRSDGREASLRQTLRVAAAASLEWLPQETIVYAGAQARMSTRVELEAGGRFIGWEMLCLGRPACAETFTHGRLLQRFELWRDGAPLWLERARFEGAASALAAQWGMQGLPLAATLVATADDKDLLQRVRAAVDMQAGEAENFSATRLDGVLVCRYLGTEAQRARNCLAAAWAEIRRSVLGREPCAPRIWNT